jgi:hypothetical protein
MVKMVSMDAFVTLERVPDLHPAVILNGDWNKGQEVSVLMSFLELNHRYSTEMEREAGSVWQKYRFMNNQLIRLARVPVCNKNKRKFVLLQNLFSSLLCKMHYFLFYLHSLVWIWTHLVKTYKLVFPVDQRLVPVVYSGGDKDKISIYIVNFSKILTFKGTIRKCLNMKRFILKAPGITPDANLKHFFRVSVPLMQ